LQSTKKYKVTVYENAGNMLDEHADFLAQVSFDAAIRLLSQFEKIIARLAENPFQFPIADELDVPNIPPNTYRKCLFEKRYKALFKVGEGEVFVDAVIDSRRENKDL
jgi:plasmid stabilization system protein ParE